MWRLTDLGWTTALDAAFRAEPDPSLVPGRVSLEHNHVYRVLVETGECLAEAAGRIKYLASGRSELPAVGDWVGVRLDPSGGRAVIRMILPRRGWFSRKAAGLGRARTVGTSRIRSTDVPMDAAAVTALMMPASQ